MNYTINEIPDEAVELSGTEMIPIWQGETKKVSVATLASSGIPVGAVMPFANGTTSENWLLCDGRDTTGTAEELQTHYPALYTYLGNSNILPAQFDHSKLSDYESITIPTAAATAITMDYDGCITISTATHAGGGAYRFGININGVSFYGGSGGSGNTGDTITVSVKKGDVVYTFSDGQVTLLTYAAFYKQPLYIKAT